ncbi:hypothetical protein [Sphingobium sp. B11D3A]|uniref:hypothetical protein n=1 Tax=Sphingobium sp. B11D3A TaxID=2940574 RepID=UPI002224E63C|nr:hypothetical protein [Sphingobium sp. B11D3A]MCW2393156.1 hypothetical protein [Sphingobium sp. B11D3A]
MNESAGITDWVTAFSSGATAVIAFVAAWMGIRTFRHQRTSYDVSMALEIFSEINRYWDRISENNSEYQYNIGQILSYFEIACSLFNKNILTKDAKDVLGDHIIEVFTGLQTSEHGKNFINSCRSSRTTFSELRKFANENFPQALNAQAFSSENSGS